MLTEYEKNRLVDEYRREPVSAVGLVLTCAAGLLLVIILALVGMDIHTYSDAQRQAITQAR
jgi:hypothetical protein